MKVVMIIIMSILAVIAQIEEKYKMEKYKRY